MKNLIFDAGGVLVYPRLGEWHIPFGAAAILGHPRAESLGTPAFKRAQAAAMGWLDESHVVMTVAEERELRRGFVRDIDTAMGWRMTPAEIDAMTDDFTDNPDRYGFFDDCAPYLAKWKRNHKLGILSDAMPSLFPLMEHFGVLPLFDAVVISTHVGAVKPDPRMFRTIVEKLNARPEDCLFVDDRMVNLEGSVKAGLRAVQMTRPEFPSDPVWDGPVVHSFAELDKLLEEGLPE